VVKAMGSAKQGYPIITKVLKKIQNKKVKVQVNHHDVNHNIINPNNYKNDDISVDNTKTSDTDNINDINIIDTLNKSLKATVHEIKRLTPNIIEIIIHAPAAAEQFQPGQFYRLKLILY
jgi:hypothetical protein